MYTTVFIDNHPLLITPVAEQYSVSTAANGKKEWTISLYASNGLIEENLGTLPYLHGQRAYIDVDGTTHKVEIVNDQAGDITTVAEIQIVLTEEGFNDATSDNSGDDIEITGSIGLTPFTGKLSDYSEDYAAFGEITRTIDGYLLQSDSPYLGDYRTYSLRVQAWNGWDEECRRGYGLNLSFSYTDPKTNTSVYVNRWGTLVGRSRSGNTITLNFEQAGPTT